MSDKSAIEWTDATWNPLLGCTKVSPGCDHCYAITNARIRESNPNTKIANAYAGLVQRSDAGLDWTGQVNLLEERLDQPLRWKKPRRIFVNAQSDLFHDAVDYAFIAKVFAVMATARQHTFQILTKRHARMRSLLSSDYFRTEMSCAIAALNGPSANPWPLPNVWLGVSVESQKWADTRGAALRETPAAVRFFSAEPLLGPVATDLTGIDWVIVGGESGHKARPMHPNWVRSLRDQCASAGVPFLFKQWGEWAPAHWKGEDGATHAFTGSFIGEHTEHFMELGHKPTSIERSPRTPGGAQGMIRPGKKAAGRELDGRTWDEYPKAVA